jgi:hypothetical protein
MFFIVLNGGSCIIRSKGKAFTPAERRQPIVEGAGSRPRSGRVHPLFGSD